MYIIVKMFRIQKLHLAQLCSLYCTYVIQVHVRLISTSSHYENIALLKKIVLKFITLTTCFYIIAEIAEEEPEVMWFKGGKKLTQTKANPRLKIDWNISDDSFYLEIRKAILDDAGKYTVVISNDSGKAEVTTDVQVKEAEVEEIKEDKVAEVESGKEIKIEEAREEKAENIEAKVILPVFKKKPESLIIDEGGKIQLKFQLEEGTIGLCDINMDAVAFLKPTYNVNIMWSSFTSE